MQINQITLDGKPITTEQAIPYITSHMLFECFMGGIEITTPDGILKAEVSLIR